jgi:hypothetical protein
MAVRRIIGASKVAGHVPGVGDDSSPLENQARETGQDSA